MVESATQLPSLFAALADPTRLQIVEALARRGPLAIGDLAKPFGMSLQAVSKHIGVLAGAGLVERARSGRSRICTLNWARLSEASAWIEHYRQFWEGSLDQLGVFLDEGDES